MAAGALIADEAAVESIDLIVSEELGSLVAGVASGQRTGSGPELEAVLSRIQASLPSHAPDPNPGPG